MSPLIDERERAGAGFATRPLNPEMVTFLGLLPVLAVAGVTRGVGLVAILIAAVTTVLVWQLLFALVRRRRPAVDGIITAIVLAIALPADLALWQVVLAASFAVIIGEQIFGGRGFSFVNTAVIALAFLLFSFTGTELAGLDATYALAVLPGAAALIGMGIVSWRLVVGAGAGLALAALAVQTPDLVSRSQALGGLAFVIVFMAADPAASSATNPGRWVHGILFGALVVLFTHAAGMLVLEAGIFAALLASIFAPLVDQAAVRINAERRRRRDG